MGVRVAAIWALIGFAVQCLVAMFTHRPFREGLADALVHYFLWGIVGFVVGTVAHRALEDSFRNLARRQQQNKPDENE